MMHFDDPEQLLGAQVLNQTPFARRTVVPAYRVGELFDPERSQWPAGAQYCYSTNGHRLTLFHPQIDDHVVDAVQRGEAEFALLVKQPVLVLAYRFGSSIPWSDVPYCWHLHPDSARMIPEAETSPETRALLWITLVGANDGVIHSQRGMTLSPSFTQAFQNAIREQAWMWFDPVECVKAISRIFLDRPTPMDRLSLATELTKGNV